VVGGLIFKLLFHKLNTCGDEDPAFDMNTDDSTFLVSVLKDLVVRTGDLESFHEVCNIAAWAS
jgi:hypothetical protein